MALFSSLSEKLQDTFKRLKGKGKLSEADIDAAMREVRIALLEADVNFKVVKKFIASVKERAIGSEVLESLTPGQQVIKIVNDELVNLMGEKEANIVFASKPPTVIMMVGLQGSGKTTSSAKLAKTFKKKGRSPLLAACDIYRPAAIKQLEVLAGQLEIPVFSKGQENPVLIAEEAVAYARNNGSDVVIIDTAGRLHIDEDLMGELENIKAQVNPTEILLVVDAMTGQDAVNVAETFDQKFGITGIILTKLDGDTRGGAALSIREVTGKPIKFVGVGEKLDALETFYPDRMASRILGMGDVLTLIEKAQETFDAKKAKEMEAKLRTQQFTLEDFLDQLQQMKSMGPLEDLLGMIPGMGKQLKNMQVDEKELVKTEAIIQSMTPKERAKPEIINGSRKKRIAMGSGTKVQDVNKLLKQFLEARKMMKQFSGGQNFKKVKKKSKGMFNLPMFK
ncbi:signal recognition particle protein [Desulfitibacter alkalitolerans]|uniref:signal recognition particle protein n=1 Tax=Desulfitibacter alkalitolerans TaxID=264641 RepID=UPI00048091BD|nr:signal recognition particle protein [Desulfitibacter alkalitolerans]